MPYQTGRNYQIAFKQETTFNTAPGAAGATGFRTTGGSGMQLSKNTFASNEIRRDGLQILGRHGMKNVEGSFNAELSLGTFDALFAAVMRDTWGVDLTITQATMTSITTQAGPPSTITAAAGSWITQGLRIGDVIRLTGHSTTSNNSRNLTITALTATVITVAESLATDAVADTSFTIVRHKKLTRLADTAYTDRTFTFEEYGIDTDLSELYTGCSVSSVRVQLQPSGMVQCTFSLVGADGQALAAGSSPYFTTPTVTTTLPMVTTDATLYVSGAPVVDLTSFDFTMTVNTQPAEVIGSYTTPALFTNQLAITGSLSALRQDLSRLSGFVAETQYSIGLKCVDNAAEPKPFMNFFFPSVKFADVSKNELGANGPRVETVPLLIGFDPTRPSTYDASSVVIQTSA